MAKTVPFHIRWMPTEWAKVAAAMVDYLDAGMDRFEALRKAQRRALPPERWIDDDTARLRAKVSGGNASHFNDYVAKARKLTPEQRMELLPLKFTQAPGSDVLPPVEPVPVVKLQRVDWTERERCLITRRVLFWRNQLGDTRATCRLVMEAQKIELPPERRRGETGLSVASKALDKMMKETKPHLWQFDKTHPFDPNRTRWEDTQPAAAPAEETPTAAPQTAPAASIHVAGTSTPTSVPQWVSTPAAQVFASEFTASVDKLMRAQQQAILEQVNARLANVGENMAKLIAVFVTNELKGLVHGVLENELGGPVAAPSVSAAGSPGGSSETAGKVQNGAPAAPEVPHPKRVKIDVVGFNLGADQTRVQQQLNGSGHLVELNFINSDKWSNYAPHSNRPVVMMQARIPHALSNKLKAAKVAPIYTKPSVGHVVTAINGILKAQGLLPEGH